MTRVLVDSRFTAIRRNLAVNPRPAGGVAGWYYSTGTGGAGTVSLLATAGAGPQGRTGVARVAVTAAPTGGSTGPFYRAGVGTAPGGLAGDVVSGSMWVRPPVATRCRISLGTRAGGTGVGSGLVGAYVATPANVWTRVSVVGPAGIDYDELQVWAQIENAATLVQAGQNWDAANVLIEKVGVLNPFFDGAMGNAKWDGAANASASTGNGYAGRI